MSGVQVTVYELGYPRSRPPKQRAIPWYTPSLPEPPLGFILEHHREVDKREIEEAKSREWDKENCRRRGDAQRREHYERLMDEALRRQRIGAAVPGSAAGTFQYTTLDNPSSQVRLLQLDVLSGQVVCIQETFSLESAPPFVAVSYTWGNPADKSVVWINSEMMIVPASCCSALHELASRRINQWIWIDAICIQQGDRDEKAHQVHMMTKIFSRALWVAAVLNDPFQTHKSAQSGSQAPDRSLEQLSKDPFWSRIWIVQEFLVAKEVRLLGAGFCIQDAVLRHNLANCRQSASISDSRMCRLVEDRYRVRGRASPTSLIFHSLAKYSDLECADPRDRIFALVPMALRDSGVEPLLPNYNEPAFETLLRFAEYVCRLESSTWEDQNSSISDLLVCLMKTTQALKLDLRSDKVRSFLTDGRPIKGKSALLWESQQFRTTCLTRPDFSMRRASDLCLEDVRQLRSVGLNMESHDFTVIYHDKLLAFATIGRIFPGDMLLSPLIGSMTTTWNLIFRKSGGHRARYDLVGQALLLKGGSRAFSRSCPCDNNTCASQSQGKALKLHVYDAVALALQARTPVERLVDAAKVPSRGSYAVLG